MLGDLGPAHLSAEQQKILRKFVVDRGGTLIVVTTEGNEALGAKADHVLTVPDAPPFVLPALLVIPLQLLAYHIAVLRGCHVDQPRNLAKSVTVE